MADLRPGAAIRQGIGLGSPHIVDDSTTGTRAGPATVAPGHERVVDNRAYGAIMSLPPYAVASAGGERPHEVISVIH
jgi:hypothetical protein